MFDIKNREKYEWVRIWWETAGNLSTPRILLIGDSITAGYRPYVNEMLQGNALVDQLAASGSISDPVYLKQLSLMLSEYQYEAVHFNNGLHGWHIDAEEYEKSLSIIINTILDKQSDSKIILATTTPSPVKGNPALINEEKDRVIKERNSVVQKLALENGLAVNDLYSCIDGKIELRSEDGSHYTPDGYKYLAEKVVDCLKYD